VRDGAPARVLSTRVSIASRIASVSGPATAVVPVSTRAATASSTVSPQRLRDRAAQPLVGGGDVGRVQVMAPGDHDVEGQKVRPPHDGPATRPAPHDLDAGGRAGVLVRCDA